MRRPGLKIRFGFQGRSSMGAPLQGCMAQNQPGAGQMTGRGNHLRRSPAMRLHDPDRVAGVLDGVQRIGFWMMEEAGTPWAWAVRAITWLR